ncbi:ATP-binding cassette domain-containing protein [Shewanella sp. D64]|uniref:peptide ABC transporter ATP-binding protein n=1 Tax=unclassified Shewanella TaxID=196818 RepID=UPI0022BA5080|nr:MULTISPECIES: oligopeptide/dipeptide ABC transporter ATP-binding protein [unclassified Shewanella]MEC4728360.1 ATP-binding cassette domain-containing protein [Shewanella sp. D64]MEC4737306.1 ATP-binding cassette domain-containing protein [Shewanella sp. E94]WBJ93683.1 ATP-binding cassette domain-containing protein [Shewanella sp. MTB7]
MPLLDIRNLTIELDTPHGRVKALERVSLTINAAEIHGLVGESGSGRSLLARAILGIPGHNWNITADRMMWDGRNLLEMSSKQRRNLMGSEISMIFQDPSSSLDPVISVGSQLIEAMPAHKKTPFWRRTKMRKQTAEKWLHKVGIKNTERVMSSYAWELSEGECQKVMIAMAVANQPRLLIADEPTNSMEVQTQAQIFRLLSKLNQLQGVSILLISHELETLSMWCDQLSVMYCGQIMESGPTSEIVARPYHPYTKALLDNIPNYSGKMTHKSIMPTLRGSAPALQHLPIGCRLGPRCPEAQKKCVNKPNLCHQKNRYFACHFPYNEEQCNDDSTASS